MTELPVPVHARFGEAMMLLFPGSDGQHDFRIEDAGSGAVLVTWTLEHDIPSDEQIEAVLAEVDRETARSNRRAAYVAESDQLALKALRLERGDVTDKEAAWIAWTDKVSEIQARFPIP